MQSLTTHRGKKAADCCKLLSFIIIKALEWNDQKAKGSDFFESLNVEEIMPELETESVKSLSKSEMEMDFFRDKWN